MKSELISGILRDICRHPLPYYNYAVLIYTDFPISPRVVGDELQDAVLSAQFRLYRA